MIFIAEFTFYSRPDLASVAAPMPSPGAAVALRN
jgi:hypothetical protein